MNRRAVTKAGKGTRYATTKNLILKNTRENPDESLPQTSKVQSYNILF